MEEHSRCTRKLKENTPAEMCSLRYPFCSSISSSFFFLSCFFLFPFLDVSAFSVFANLGQLGFSPSLSPHFFFSFLLALTYGGGVAGRQPGLDARAPRGLSPALHVLHQLRAHAACACGWFERHADQTHGLVRVAGHAEHQLADRGVVALHDPRLQAIAELLLVLLLLPEHLIDNTR